MGFEEFLIEYGILFSALFVSAVGSRASLSFGTRAPSNGTLGNFGLT